jgi:hypothetical protein
MLLAYKTLAWKWNPARCDLDTHRDGPLSDRVADYGNEAYATSWLAAQVVRQPELRILYLTLLRLASELQPHLVHHAQP